MSKLELTPDDISLLDKGLTFIPTYRHLPIAKIYETQNRLIRNLKLKDYFHGRQDKDYDPSKKTFVKPSTWTPPDDAISVDTLGTIQKIVGETENVLKNSKILNSKFLILNGHKNNLSTAERRALNRLKRDDSIVIKPADKGSATVVMDKEAYLAEAYRQLNNGYYYRKLEEPIYKENVPKLNKILQTLRTEGFISDKQVDFLRASENDRTRIFYLLPKIHKPRNKWPRSDMPEGRPIVSDCGSESYRICQYIDSFIRPISIRHPSYIKDTYDFVSKIRGQKVPKNAILVTGDVSSLYTNMKIDRILKVTESALRKHPQFRRPDRHILDLLDITLNNNDFTFNGEFFLQICGTAMGKTYAPGLADMYLEDFDERAMNGFRIKPLLFYRFLDDIFFIWTGSEADLKEFENYLNTLIDGIKITFNFSTDKVDFLDTTIYKSPYLDSDILQTRVFFKETDTHQLLHKNSFHPKHTSRGVLKSQLLRFKRISSSLDDYNGACKSLFDALTKRNYSKSMLRKMKRDIWRDNTELNSKVTTFANKILPIVIPYNQIGTTLVRLWKRSITNNKLFSETRLIAAYCNSKNLHKRLIRSTVSAADALPVTRTLNRASRPTCFIGCRRCPNTKCRACNFVAETKSFRSSVNARTFELHSGFTCKSSNICYLVTCRACQKQYIGETGRTLADRITDHISAIRLKKPTPIGLHFNLSGHSIKHFSILAIEQFENTENSQYLRRLKEVTWQNLLQTAHPLGINNLKLAHVRTG